MITARIRPYGPAHGARWRWLHSYTLLNTSAASTFMIVATHIKHLLISVLSSGLLLLASPSTASGTELCKLCFLLDTAHGRDASTFAIVT
eukprot:2194317-Pleurochrysis_carterae.AAC.1